MFKLTEWRVYVDLDYDFHIDPSYIDPGRWAECSLQTQQLAEVYANYTYYKCCDSRPHLFYPLLDRIVAWMDETYA